MIANTWDDRAKAAYERARDILYEFHREVLAEANAKGVGSPGAQEALAAERKALERLSKLCALNALRMNGDPAAQKLADTLFDLWGAKETP